MKVVLLSALLLVISVGAFQQPQQASTGTTTKIAAAAANNHEMLVVGEPATAATTRKSFLNTLTIATTVGILGQQGIQPAHARGRATLEKSYERYAPRIVAGAQFYGGDLRKMVERTDWKGIRDAVAEPRERTKDDLAKPDSGVSERAKGAGEFSDSRVVVAADLFAGAFSDSSISAKTKKMKASVEKIREAVAGMQSTAKLALGEEKSGGLFGFGGKKPSDAELAKQLRQYYVAGGNAFNEYLYTANDDLAIQFDRLPYVG